MLYQWISINKPPTSDVRMEAIGDEEFASEDSETSALRLSLAAVGNGPGGSGNHWLTIAAIAAIAGDLPFTIFHGGGWSPMISVKVVRFFRGTMVGYHSFFELLLPDILRTLLDQLIHADLTIQPIGLQEKCSGNHHK